MPHPGILRRASQITIWHWNMGRPQEFLPTKHTE
jgi:hypothetical protein